MLKDNILNYFIENENQVTSLSKLANLFNVSKTACWKAVNKLVEEGHTIVLEKNSGYIYNNDDILSIVEINKYTNFKCVELFEKIDSTNTYLKNNSNKNHRDIVVAVEQLAGRGRRGNSFLSLKNRGVYFSFYYDKVVDINYFAYITICSALALRRALKQLYDVSVDIKWLNDLYFNNRKLAGILTEVVVQAEEMSVGAICIGIGLNTKEVDETINEFAIGLEEITDKIVNRNILIATIVNNFEMVFEQCFINKQYDLILSEYRDALFILNKKIKITIDKQIVTGIALDINNKAELIVDVDGKQHIYNTGEVSTEVIR